MTKILQTNLTTPQTDPSPAAKNKYSTPHHRLTPSDWAEPNYSSPQAKITEIAQWNKFKNYLNNKTDEEEEIMLEKSCVGYPTDSQSTPRAKTLPKGISEVALQIQPSTFALRSSEGSQAATPKKWF